MQDILSKIWELLSIYGLKVVAAVAVFIIGRWVAKMLTTVTEKVMNKRQVDPTITSFAGNLIYIALLVFVVLAALGQLGIQTTSFIAVIGAAGLAVGLALQGSLSNFAAGFLMIIFRPFKVGDFIEGAGVAGTVEAIHIFTTQLLTPDNKTVIVPNAGLTAGNITNYSAKGTRRVDLIFGIGYGDDIDHTKKIIWEVLNNETRILKDPAPVVMLTELADSSVNFAVRPWVTVADYWEVHSSLIENIKKSFDAQGISIPFPQRDVHLYEHKAQP
ncbi:MAG: mechanosensitive ion channel domain-containing protein [Desulfobacterales bacterium]